METGAGELRIGWASGDITPPRPCSLHGQFYLRVSQGTMDPLTVTALALESAGGRHGDSTVASGKQGAQAILVSCDLVGVWASVHQRIREEVRRRLSDFDADLFFAGATHTHAGPTLEKNWYEPQPPPVMTEDEAAQWFIVRTADAIEEAWKNRAPGGVSRAYGQAVVGHNRRAVYRDGATRMYGVTRDAQFECFEGYEDHGLDLLCTFDPKGQLTGVLVNLACPSQLSEHELKFTADYWHDTRVELRRRLGEGLFVLPQCGPAGDQSPHLLIRKDLEAQMWQRRGVTQRQEVARRIGQGVEDALALSRADIRGDLVLRHRTERMNLPVRMVTPQECDQARAEIARFGAVPKIATPSQTGGGSPYEDAVKIRYALVGRAERTLARFEEQKRSPTLPVELHVLRLGDAAFATNPFECFLDFGLRIKARSAAAQTFCVQLAAGYQGYLPTARAMKGGHYGAEVASNQVGPEGGQMMVDRTVELIEELFR
jgi:hypothetical protein